MAGQQGCEGWQAGTGEDACLPRGAREAPRRRQCGAGSPTGWLHVDRDSRDTSQRALNTTMNSNTTQPELLEDQSGSVRLPRSEVRTDKRGQPMGTWTEVLALRMKTQAQEHYEGRPMGMTMS